MTARTPALITAIVAAFCIMAATWIPGSAANTDDSDYMAQVQLILSMAEMNASDASDIFGRYEATQDWAYDAITVARQYAFIERAFETIDEPSATLMDIHAAIAESLGHTTLAGEYIELFITTDDVAYIEMGTAEMALATEAMQTANDLITDAAGDE